MSARMAYNALTRAGGHIGPPLQIATSPTQLDKSSNSIFTFNQQTNFMKYMKMAAIAMMAFALFSCNNKKNEPKCVLFLKKVHSWGGVTEMVHGSFLSVL